MGIAADPNFGVLFVCTGNICRSPTAERLLATRLADPGPVTVTSAGTSGLVGYAMDGPSAAVLRELGGDPAGHVGRQLTAPMVEGASLVLAAQAAHRSGVLALAPMAFRRTFTMREFARLGAGLGDLARPSLDALHERVRAVARLRGVVDPVEPAQDDIGDPFGAPIEVVRMAGQQVADAVDEIIVALGLGSRLQRPSEAPRRADEAPQGRRVDTQ